MKPPIAASSAVVATVGIAVVGLVVNTENVRAFVVSGGCRPICAASSFVRGGRLRLVVLTTIKQQRLSCLPCIVPAGYIRYHDDRQQLHFPHEEVLCSLRGKDSVVPYVFCLGGSPAAGALHLMCLFSRCLYSSRAGDCCGVCPLLFGTGGRGGVQGERP